MDIALLRYFNDESERHWCIILECLTAPVVLLQGELKGFLYLLRLLSLCLGQTGRLSLPCGSRTVCVPLQLWHGSRC